MTPWDAQAAVVVIALGQFTTLVDLGNRLFGSYDRSTPAALRRMLVILAAILLEGVPLLMMLAWPRSPVGYRLLWPFAILSLVVIAHYLFPSRFGVRRPPRYKYRCDRSRQLVPGVVERIERWEPAAPPPPPDGPDRACVTGLVVSDLHCNSDHRLAQLRESIRRLDPVPLDFVALVGDLTEKAERLPEVFGLLGGIRTRRGVFAVRGNHDLEHGRGNLFRRVAESCGVRVLANETVCPGDSSLAFVGLEWPWNRDRLPPPVPDGRFGIGLSHTPDNVFQFRSLNVRLALSGHTHGGQYRLPLIGPVLIPSRYGRLLDRGWFEVGRTALYVTSGFGYSPGHFGQPGQVVVLELARGASAAGKLCPENDV